MVFFSLVVYSIISKHRITARQFDETPSPQYIFLQHIFTKKPREIREIGGENTPY